MEILLRRTKWKNRGAMPRAKGQALKGRGVIEDGLDNVQRAVMVIIVGSVAGDGLDAVGSVTHGESVFHQLQHFGVIAAVADGDALLRRKIPALEQTADAAGFMQGQG